MNPREFSDYETYIVFKRTPSDQSESHWGIAIVGPEEFIGHDEALRTAINLDPPEVNFPALYLTVNVTSGTVREHKVKISIEGIN